MAKTKNLDPFSLCIPSLGFAMVLNADTNLPPNSVTLNYEK